MPFTEPTTAPSSPPTYAAPSHNDLAAVAATVAIVGVFMAIVITWLIFRLRRASQTPLRPSSTTSYNFRPSFAPSEASSKFGFTRKPLRLSHRHEDDSWDFADPDPFSYSKEAPVRTPSQKHRPAPLPSAPTYTPRAHRASMHKDELGPHTPVSVDHLELPPPAYCPDSTSPWHLYQPKSL